MLGLGRWYFALFTLFLLAQHLDPAKLVMHNVQRAQGHKYYSSLPGLKRNAKSNSLVGNIYCSLEMKILDLRILMGEFCLD